MDICEKLWIPDGLTEDEAYEWALDQCVLYFESGGYEFINTRNFISILSHLLTKVDYDQYAELA